MVLRHHSAGMTEGVRVLLLVLADRMRAERYVSVPRSELAQVLDVAPRRVTERILIAKELGLLDTVAQGRPGVTAVYQGLFPSGAHVRTTSRRKYGALGRTSAETTDGVHGRTFTDPDGAHGRTTAHGAGERTSTSAVHGAHGRPASSKHNHSSDLTSEPTARREQTPAQQRDSEEVPEHAPVLALVRVPSPAAAEQTQPLPPSLTEPATRRTTCRTCDQPLVTREERARADRCGPCMFAALSQAAS